MHKEVYKYVGRLSDGTTVLFEKRRWVSDREENTVYPWIHETSMREIMDAYNEFREMMD